MASVGAMVLLSLLSSSICLYRMTEVSRLLKAINHVSVPLGRAFTQIQSDAEIFHRELERCLGYSHWTDPYWKPRPTPRWVEGILKTEVSRIRDLVQRDFSWAEPDSKRYWIHWIQRFSAELDVLLLKSNQLYSALVHKDEKTAVELYPQWMTGIEEWKRKLQWGSAELEKSLRQNFAVAENQVIELRTSLEVILIIVVLLSLLLLWLGEQALRPLGELTLLAREITRRGLRKEDKILLPEIPISRSDEVSQLSREFHHMATALLEREKTVETQKSRLQEQNSLLLEMGQLNQNILNSIKSILIVTDFSGRMTQCNPQAVVWLGKSEEEMMGSDLLTLEKLQAFFPSTSDEKTWLERFKETKETWRLGPLKIEERVYGGNMMPLRQDQGFIHGAIIVLDDLTEEHDLEERLRRAENLAAVGRMSAQVAHEVRNPLHSIGLEAEMAAELATRLGSSSLKQSFHSILISVDRLQKITENYLKLSRLSDGQKSRVDLGQLLESVLSTYAPVCEVQGVQVYCKSEKTALLQVWADKDLLEQVLGNLLKNSLQALEGFVRQDFQGPQIWISLGNTETDKVWLRIEDNGPGISPEVKDRLFNPFVTTRAQGTGLGLSFVKQVIEEHCGMIRHRDRAMGYGACFELTLPFLSEGISEKRQIEQEVFNA